MIISILRFRSPAQLFFAALVLVCSNALAANPTPRGGGPGVPTPSPTQAATPSPTATPAGMVDEKLFKSMQWRQIGPFRGGRALAIEGVIGALIVDPRNADVVLVAALGHAFGPNQERGIFRTADGGKTWTKVLSKDENTGGIDVVFDPHNPNIVFASLWQARRQPWFFSSG